MVAVSDFNHNFVLKKKEKCRLVYSITSVTVSILDQYMSLYIFVYDKDLSVKVRKLDNYLTEDIFEKLYK